MNQNPIAEAVIRLAAPVVESLGLVIWGVEVAQSGRMVVRLFVDVPSDGRNPHAVAEELADAVCKAAGIESHTVLATLKGSEFELMTAVALMVRRPSKSWSAGRLRMPEKLLGSEPMMSSAAF